MPLSKKAVLDFFSRLRHRRSNERTDLRDTDEVFFLCDQCFAGIKEGSNRYNCMECGASYDLCENCYRRGVGSQHLQENGYLHTFNLETASHFKLRSLVMADTLEDTIRNALHFYSGRPALGQYNESKGALVYTTYGALRRMVEQFASGLRQLMSADFHPMVAMCANSRMEWYISDFACILLGLPTAPLSVTADKDNMRFIVNQAEVSVVVCSADMVQPLLSLASECPTLKSIIAMEPGVGDVLVQAAVKLVNFADVLSAGERNPVNLTKIRPDPNAVFTITYTSGSTGQPKGCVFSRKAWNAKLSGTATLGVKKVWLSFHPPAHNFERRNIHDTLISGGKTGIYRGSMEHLFDDFALVRPTIVACTPRFWTLLYNQYLYDLHDAYRKHLATSDSTVESDAQEETEIVETEPSKKQQEHIISDDDEEVDTKQLNLTPQEGVSGTGISSVKSSRDIENFDMSQVPLKIKQRVLRKYKSVLGGREQLVSTGGAPTGENVKRFMIECFNGIPQEGYGTTEVGGIASNGIIFSNNDVKLIDVPEMGYFTTDDPPRGEICVKTPQMIDGYYKNPKETEERFVDGYFRTGDIGEQNSFGNLRVIDRKKSIFKLSQGEFVAPERLESLYVNNTTLISQMYIYGSSLQTNIVAVVVPHQDSLNDLWKSQHTPSSTANCPTIEELCRMAEVKAVYLQEIRTIARAKGLQGWEVPVGVVLEPEPFTREAGLLTLTFKQCRPKLEQKYRPVLEKLYQEVNSAQIERPLEICIVEHFKQLINHDLSAEVPELTPNKLSLPANFMANSFAELGGDSLAATRFSTLVDEHLYLKIPVEVILKQPLMKLLDFIRSKDSRLQYAGEYHFTQSSSSHMSDSMTHKSIDWVKEASLDNLKLHELRQTVGNRSTSKETCSVFLTGATGFLGRFILLELLQNNHCDRIYCLVQNKPGISIRERLHSTLSEMYSELSLLKDPREELTAGRVIPLEGDLSKPRLGLEDQDYDMLCKEVHVIIHNGAVVNAALPYLALQAANVESTKEILRIACSWAPKFLHYVSTIGVFAPLSPSEHIDEHSTPSHDRLYRLSGYAQSKWVSERLVLQAIERGLVTGNISRPGLIGPHTITGHANVQDWVCWLVRGLASLKLYPVGPGCNDKCIHWVPVDQVARAVVHFSMECQDFAPLENTYVLHLVNDTPVVNFSDLVETLRRLFRPDMTATDYNNFRTELHRQAHTSNERVLSSLDLLLPQFGGWPYSHTHCCLAKTVLEPRQIHLNVLPEQYVELYLQYLQSKGMI